MNSVNKFETHENPLKLMGDGCGDIDNASKHNQ